MSHIELFVEITQPVTARSHSSLYTLMRVRVCGPPVEKTNVELLIAGFVSRREGQPRSLPLSLCLKEEEEEEGFVFVRRAKSDSD